jgi:uncharacterized protein YbgA (DUF1722 family)/uncharacterized protein YbbK (DUF523 family)
MTAKMESLPGTGLRPLVVVSRCLGFARCRWNGDVMYSAEVSLLGKHADFMTVCPECDAGLGVPRKPIRIVLVDGAHRVIQYETNRDFTAEITGFSTQFLSELGAVDGFILKDRSPSCGTKDVKVYRGAEKTSPVAAKASGLFAAAVLARFGDLAVENEGRLVNTALREHFFTKLFTLARFRALASAPSASGLVDFHRRHKYLLMAYNQAALRDMGRIVARAGSATPDEFLGAYRAHLARALRAVPRPAAHINVLTHLMGYFKKGLSAREKKHFLDTAGRFRDGAVPLSSCAGIIGSWIARFDESYLADQVYLEPFPAALVKAAEAGGRKLHDNG